MGAAALCLFAWSFDRIEPPYAVLYGEDGAEISVPLSELPPEAEPGDTLPDLKSGRVIKPTAAERAALRDQLEGLLALETEGTLLQAPAMRREMDTFAKRAQREGFRARSVYKLEEIDKRTQLFRSGQAVLDLGCAPGSWLQYASRRVGKKGRVLGIDLQAVAPLPAANVKILQRDAFNIEADELVELGGPFDVVISDMAPATTGNRLTDHVRSMELCQRALRVALRGLKPGGAFVCKAFEGPDLNDLAAEIKPHFKKVRRIKPKATRKESVELFFVAQGFKASEG